MSNIRKDRKVEMFGSSSWNQRSFLWVKSSMTPRLVAAEQRVRRNFGSVVWSKIKLRTDPALLGNLRFRLLHPNSVTQGGAKGTDKYSVNV